MLEYSCGRVLQSRWNCDQCGRHCMGEHMVASSALASMGSAGEYWCRSCEQKDRVLSVLGWLSLAVSTFLAWWILAEVARIGYALLSSAGSRAPQLDGLVLAVVAAGISGTLLVVIALIQTSSRGRGRNSAAPRSPQKPEALAGFPAFPLRSVSREG